MQKKNLRIFFLHMCGLVRRWFIELLMVPHQTFGLCKRLIICILPTIPLFDVEILRFLEMLNVRSIPEF